MDRIYGNAILSIVAAYGHHADSGLPGVGEGSQAGNQFKLVLDGIRVSFRSRTNMIVTLGPPASLRITSHHRYIRI